MQASADECARQVLEVVPLIMRTIRIEMRSHRLQDISVPQFRTLAFLNGHGGASLSEVAEFIGLTLPSMSKMIDGLVARGLVTRQTHAGDRRRMTLALTPAGQSIYQSAHMATQACLAQHLDALPLSERAAIVQAMQALHPVFIPNPNREAEPEAALEAALESK